MGSHGRRKATAIAFLANIRLFQSETNIIFTLSSIIARETNPKSSLPIESDLAIR